MRSSRKYVLLARRYSEGEDQVLVGFFLPVISAVLARNVYINFGRRMFPNLYCILVTRRLEVHDRAIGDPYCQ